VFFIKELKRVNVVDIFVFKVILFLDQFEIFFFQIFMRSQIGVAVVTKQTR
jgi:hypothetical protein